MGLNSQISLAIILIAICNSLLESNVAKQGWQWRAATSYALPPPREV